jgi:hypothetical protein
MVERLNNMDGVQVTGAALLDGTRKIDKVAQSGIKGTAMVVQSGIKGMTVVARNGIDLMSGMATTEKLNSTEGAVRSGIKGVGVRTIPGREVGAANVAMDRAAPRGTEIMASTDEVVQNGIGLLIDMVVLGEIWNGVEVAARNGIELMSIGDMIRTEKIEGVEIMAMKDVVTR